MNVETQKNRAAQGQIGVQSKSTSQRSDEELHPPDGPGQLSTLPERTWRYLSATVMLAAAVLRFYRLALVPLHHDEGVNGYFLTSLFRSGVYHYDPANYHGPSLYYLALLTTKLNSLLFGKAGLSTVAIRLVPAIIGLATVWLMLELREYIGDYGALGAAGLVAISPGSVYFSRYFIHEIPFAFFTLGIVVALLRYYKTADPPYLMLASASAALLFATKETAIISVIVLILAYVCAITFQTLRTTRMPEPSKAVRAKRRRRASSEETTVPAGSHSDWVAHLGGRRRLILLSLGALAIFLGIHILLYSSFFTNRRGVYDSVATFKYWTATGVRDDIHDVFTYLRWLGQEELPLLLLGTAGFVLALFKLRNRFALFAGFWAAGMLAAYSLIPYKTPWLALNIIVPLAVVSGCGIEMIVGKIATLRRERVRVFLASAAGISLIMYGYQAIDLSFSAYDDDSQPYVYAHTRRQLFPMLEKIDQIATQSGSGLQTSMTLTSSEYWPLPWYLRDYPNAGWWGHMVPTQEVIVIGEESQEAELRRNLGDKYERVGSYDLRPGVVLVMFVRKDLRKP